MICGFMSVGLFYVNDRSDTALLVICAASTFLIGNLRMKCTMAFSYMLLYAAVCGQYLEFLFCIALAVGGVSGRVSGYHLGWRVMR